MRPLLVSERKTKMRLMRDKYGRFLSFKLSTQKVGGGANLDDQKVKYFGLSDLIIEDDDNEYSIFPKLSITDDVDLLGNMFSNDYDSTKSYSKIELKVDMLEVYLEAQLRTNEFFDISVTGTGAVVDSSFCNVYDPAYDPPPITFHEQFKDDILQAYRDSVNGVFDEVAIQGL